MLDRLNLWIGQESRIEEEEEVQRRLNLRIGQETRGDQRGIRIRITGLSPICVPEISLSNDVVLVSLVGQKLGKMPRVFGAPFFSCCSD